MNTFKAGSHCSMWMKSLAIKLIFCQKFLRISLKSVCLACFIIVFVFLWARPKLILPVKKSLSWVFFGSQPESTQNKLSRKIAANDYSPHLQSFLLDLASVENFSEFNAHDFVFFFWVVTCSLGRTLNWPKGLKWSRYKTTTPISMMSSFSLPRNPLHL